MREQTTRTIAVELIVRHAGVGEVVTHSYEHVVPDADQPEWRNRRITAAVDKAVAQVLADFGVTMSQIERGRAGDFISAPAAPRMAADQPTG